jgi:4-amino-4-deoxy-L-arabinose transferase-like glycosyltransferase
MTNDTAKIDSAEAKRKLESIKSLEGMALHQAMPSKWFGLAIALVVGLLVFLIGAGLREYYVFPIIALPIIIAIQRYKTKASPRAITMNKKTIIALVGLIAFILGLILLAIYIRDSYGTLLGAIVSGVIATLAAYCISWFERKEYQGRIDQDAGNE